MFIAVYVYIWAFSLNKDSFSITAAFHMQKDDIHLETCCITGNLLVWLSSIVQTNCPVVWCCILFFYDFSEMNDTVVDGIHRPVVYGIGKWWICYKDAMFLVHYTHWLLLCRHKCQNRWSVSFIIYSQRTCRGATIHKDLHWGQGAVILKSTCFACFEGPFQRLVWCNVRFVAGSVEYISVQNNFFLIFSMPPRVL